MTFSGERARSNVPQITAEFPSLSYATIDVGTKTPGIASLGETQRVRILTSGNTSSFTLSVVLNGTTYTTASISTSAGKDEVQAALNNAIAAASGATMTVTYWSGTELQVQFGGTLAGTDIATMTGTATSSVTAAKLTQTVEGFNQPAVPPTSTIVVVDYAAHPVVVATGLTTYITLTLDGALGELTQVSGTMSISLLGETVDLSGHVAMKMSTPTIKVRGIGNLETSLQMNAFEVGFTNGSASINIGSQSVGLNNLTMGLIYYTPSIRLANDTRSWLSLKTIGGIVTAGNVALPGVSNIGVGINKGFGELAGAANETFVDIRRSFETFSGLNNGAVSVNTDFFDTIQNLPRTVRLDYDRELTSMSAEIELVIGDFFYTHGAFTYEDSTDTVTLVGSTTQINVSVRTYSVQNVAAFVGSNYRMTDGITLNPNRAGFDLTGASFYYITMTETGGEQRVWKALRASANSMGLVGFSEFELTADSIEVTINTDAADASRIQSTTQQYISGGLSISFGQNLRQLTGTGTLDIAGAVQVHGGFAFEDKGIQDVTISKGGVDTEKEVRVTTFGFQGVNAFFGAGPYFQDSNGDTLIDDNDTPNSNAAGLLLSDGNLAVANFTPTVVTDTARYYAVKATLADISLPGLVNSDSNSSFVLDAGGYRIELNKGNTAADGWTIDFAQSPAEIQSFSTGPSSVETFNYTTSLERVAIEHGLLQISDFVYASGGFAVTRQQQMSVPLSDSTNTVVNALVFGAGDVDMFVGSGTYFEDTNADGIIDSQDTRNSAAVGLALEHGNFAIVLMTPLAGDQTGRKWTAVKATAGNLAFVGMEGFDLNATGVSVELNEVRKAGTPQYSTVVDFTQMTGGQYTADTGSGSLTFDYSDPVTSVVVNSAKLQIADGLYVQGGFVYESDRTQKSVRIAKPTTTLTKTVTVQTLAFTNVTVFAGSGPYYNSNGSVNDDAAGLLLSGGNLAVAIFTPTGTTSQDRYYAIKSSLTNIAFPGIADTNDSSFVVDSSGYRVEWNGGNTAAAGGAVNFRKSYQATGALHVKTGPLDSDYEVFDYTASLTRVAVEHALLKISDFIYVSGGFAVTSQQLSVNFSNTLSQSPSNVSALVFGAGNVDVFVGNGPYFEDTNGDDQIDDLDTLNPDAVGFAIQNGSFAMMIMSPLTGGASKKKYKAFKATADRVGLVGIDSFSLYASDIEVNYNDVYNPNNANDTAAVDFSRMSGGHYSADIGSGTLLFDYSQPVMSAETADAELRIESNVFIRGGFAFTRHAAQQVTMSNGSTETLSGFDIGASDVYVFAGVNGPYYRNETPVGLSNSNPNAVGVALWDTDIAVTVLRPTTGSNNTKYIGLKASSAFFGFVGIDAFQLEASNISVELNV
ncbi:MAG: hypothetical protein WCK86_20350, partial [Planctomycetia bacterium]